MISTILKKRKYMLPHPLVSTAVSNENYNPPNST